MLKKLPSAVGRALKRVKSGAERTLYHSPDFAGVPADIRVTSPAFAHDQPLPTRFTADGAKLSPSLAWTGVPQAARSLVLVIEDADSPTPLPITHAIVLGLHPDKGSLVEGALPGPDHPGEPHRMGLNSHFQKSYLPPSPPPGHGVHRYLFQCFALGEVLQCEDHPGALALHEALRGRVIARGLLIGTYRRD